MKQIILMNYDVVTCETCEFHNLQFMAETCSQCHNHEDYSPVYNYYAIPLEKCPKPTKYSQLIPLLFKNRVED